MIEIQTKTKSELAHALLASREKLRAFRFAMTGGKIKNVREGRAVRKDIARILTALRANK